MYYFYISYIGICPYRQLNRINIPLKVMFGQLELHTLKCYSDALLGKQIQSSN